MACAFKLFCDCVGIKCLVALGKASQVTSGNGHAWNVVQIDNCNYHVDVTWNLIKGKSKYGKYNYFNLTDKDIGDDHYWDKGFYPKCHHIEHNFYYYKKLYANNLEDIQHLIRYFIKNKKHFLPIRCINFIPSFDEIDTIIKKEFKKTDIERIGTKTTINKKGYIYIDFNYK